VWGKHVHSRDDDGEVVMMMVVAANTYRARAQSLRLAAARSISPP